MENDIPKEFIQNYITNRQKDLVVLTEFLTNKNYSEIAKRAHIIKGNAASFGFPDLGMIGIDLEEAALSGHEADTRLCILQMNAWLTKVLHKFQVR